MLSGAIKNRESEIREESQHSVLMKILCRNRWKRWSS